MDYWNAKRFRHIFFTGQRLLPFHFVMIHDSHCANLFASTQELRWTTYVYVPE